MNMRGNFSIACDTLNSGGGVDYLVGDTAILFANAVNNSIPASFPLTTVQTFVNVCLFGCLMQPSQLNADLWPPRLFLSTVRLQLVDYHEVSAVMVNAFPPSEVKRFLLSADVEHVHAKPHPAAPHKYIAPRFQIRWHNAPVLCERSQYRQ
jgi:hypothetical protein